MCRSWKVVTCFALLVAGASSAPAGMIFYANDAGGFASAMSGNTSLGVEDFEGSTLGPAVVTAPNDPLTQGVANSVYPVGLTAPLTVQSNLSGGAAATTNPRGNGGLAAVSAGFGNIVSDVVLANFSGDSLDLIFAAGDQVLGVGFNPINIFETATLNIQVFSTSNSLLGATTITGNPAGTNFLGIEATGGDLIGRINIFSTANWAEGADNVQIFSGPAAVPEPGSLTLAGLGALGLVIGALRRRRTPTAA